MLISTTVMSERARPSGLAKPERLKWTAEKCPWEIGVRNTVENVEETHGIFHLLVSTDLKVGGGAWTSVLFKSSQGPVEGTTIQRAHKSERFFQDRVN